MQHIFQSEQWLPHPVDQVFAFFADPANLPRLMPPWQRARIEASSIVPPPPPRTATDHLLDLTKTAGTGTRLTLSFRPVPFSPIRLQWEAEITSFIWNQHFADTQLRGPFAHWHHVHTVTSESRLNDLRVAVPGTFLRDEVQYQLPFGKLGDLSQPLIAHQLRRTFAYRHRRTLQLLPIANVSL